MSKELKVIDRARKALSAVTTEQALEELAAKHRDLTRVKDKTDLALAMSALAEFRATRVNIEKAGKAARDDANAFSKAVIVEERRLVGIIKPEETRIQEIRADYEDELERQRQEQARIEAARVAKIRARIAAFGETVLNVSHRSASDIALAAAGLDDVLIGDDYAEFADVAEAELAKAKQRLAELHTDAIAREKAEAEAQARAAAEAEQRRKEAEELARQRAEQARIAAELKAKQAAIERQQREIEAATRAEQAERDKQAAAERAELERERQQLETERAALAQAEAERIAAEQAKARAKAGSKRKKPPTMHDEIDAWASRFSIADDAFIALQNIIAKYQKDDAAA